MAAEQDRAFEDVAQLADVAGPGVAAQRPLGGRRQPDAAAEIVGEDLEQAVSEHRDVLRPLAQRRDVERDRADPEVEVAAELPLAHQLRQVLVRGGDQLHVDLAVAHLAEPTEALLLEDLEQLRLDLRIEVADLVEEHDAAVRDLEQSRLAADRAGEGALLVPEQLRLEELAGEPGAVHVDEGLVRARPVAVEPARQDALAAARLALDQDRAARGGEPAGLARELADGGGAAGERVDQLACLACAPRDLAALLALALQQPLQHDEQGRQLDGLREELVGALLDRAHGQVDRRVAGQHHDRQRGLEVLDLPDQVERGAVGQQVVEHHRVRPAFAQRLLGGRQGVGLVDLEARGLEEGPHAEADAGFVVDDQDLGQSGTPPGAGLSHVFRWMRAGG